MGRCTKDSADVYFRQTRESNWRARSVFKLIEIDEKEKILDGVKTAIDLCAAPGSWSQYISRQGIKTIAVDLQEISPIEGVQTIVGDITDPEIIQKTCDCIDGKADIVLSDGAPEVVGIASLDCILQEKLLMAILQSLPNLLLIGGTFVTKYFEGPGFSHLLDRLSHIFEKIDDVKLDSTRKCSKEVFIVCKKYNGIDINSNRFLSIGDLSENFP